MEEPGWLAGWTERQIDRREKKKGLRSTPKLLNGKTLRGPNVFRNDSIVDGSREPLAVEDPSNTMQIVRIGETRHLNELHDLGSLEGSVIFSENPFRILPFFHALALSLTALFSS